MLLKEVESGRLELLRMQHQQSSDVYVHRISSMLRPSSSRSFTFGASRRQLSVLSLQRSLTSLRSGQGPLCSSSSNVSRHLTAGSAAASPAAAAATAAASILPCSSSSHCWFGGSKRLLSLQGQSARADGCGPLLQQWGGSSAASGKAAREAAFSASQHLLVSSFGGQLESPLPHAVLTQPSLQQAGSNALSGTPPQAPAVAAAEQLWLQHKQQQQQQQQQQQRQRLGFGAELSDGGGGSLEATCASLASLVEPPLSPGQVVAQQ
ncbi:hypothetical protein Efla_001429 [Eimeria flavescens]